MREGERTASSWSRRRRIRGGCGPLTTAAAAVLISSRETHAFSFGHRPSSSSLRWPSLGARSLPHSVGGLGFFSGSSAAATGGRGPGRRGHRIYGCASGANRASACPSRPGRRRQRWEMYCSSNQSRRGLRLLMRQEDQDQDEEEEDFMASAAASGMDEDSFAAAMAAAGMSFPSPSSTSSGDATAEQEDEEEEEEDYGLTDGLGEDDYDAYSGGDAPSFRDLYGRPESNPSLPGWLIDRLEEVGFPTPTLVQRRAMGTIMAGEDAMLHAQTGSGKTLAFLLPLLASLDPTRSSVQALVVVPTRELALQVAAVARKLAAGTGADTGGKILIMSVLEGSKNKRQRAWARAEPPHAVIGNPESLSNLVMTGAIRCHSVKMVVVDEADACMLTNASKAALQQLLGKALSPTFNGDEQGKNVLSQATESFITGVKLPGNRRPSPRQTIFASATLPQHKHFIKQCLKEQWTLTEPVHIRVHPKEAMPKSLSHFYVTCAQEQKVSILRSLVGTELEPSENRALVFALPIRPIEEMALALSKDYKSKRADAETLTADGEEGQQQLVIQEQQQGEQLVLQQEREQATLLDGQGDRGNEDAVRGDERGAGGGEEREQEAQEAPLAASDGRSGPSSSTIESSSERSRERGGRRKNQRKNQRKEKQEGQAYGQTWKKSSLKKGAANFAMVMREDLGLNKRADTMDLLRDGSTTRVLVTTDMAARGLDVTELSHVFLFDLPTNPEDYVHRGGRAGRLGRPGKVISLVSKEEEFVLIRLANAVGVDIQKMELEPTGPRRRRKTPPPP